MAWPPAQLAPVAPRRVQPLGRRRAAAAVQPPPDPRARSPATACRRCPLTRARSTPALPGASPQDGVYPEKVNAGRSGDNTNMRRIGQNQEPVAIKFSGKIPAEF